MKQCLFSILIPVFNTGKVLSRCLDSILKQSCRDFEIILVDDASTDDSLQIAKKYAKQDSRLKVIALSENSGRDNARLTAIKAASGHYIIFCDSDDELLPDFLKRAAKYAETDSDIIVFGRTHVSGDLVSPSFRRQMRTWTLKHQQILKGKEIFRAFFMVKKFPCALWGKCIKAKILQYYTPLEIGNCTGSDFLRMIHLLFHAETLLYVRDQGYVYYYGAGIWGRKNYTLSQIQVFANGYRIYSEAEHFLKENNLPAEYFSMLKMYQEENLTEVLRMSTCLPNKALEDGQKMLYDIWGEKLYFHVLSQYLARAEKQYSESLSWKITRPLRWMYDFLLYNTGIKNIRANRQKFE